MSEEGLRRLKKGREQFPVLEGLRRLKKGRERFPVLDGNMSAPMARWRPAGRHVWPPDCRAEGRAAALGTLVREGENEKLLTFSLFLALPLFWIFGKNSELRGANTVRAKLPSAGSAEKDLKPQTIISTLYIYKRFQTDN